MRAILLILIVALVVVIIAVATGFLNISQIRGGQLPSVTANGTGIKAQGGQAPAFDVETGSVKVGTQPANVQLPTLEVSQPSNAAAASANNAM